MASNPHLDLFKEETFELLSELETSLLELEETPHNEELIRRAFRTMHTIKGTGGMFGFEAIKSIAHEIESIFELVNQGKLVITQELVNLTLSACDYIKNMINQPEHSKEKDEPAVQEFIDSIRELIPTEADNVASSYPSSFGYLIDPSIIELLSEKEEIQLRRMMAENKKIYVKNVVMSKSNFDKCLFDLTEKFKKEVELISTIPHFGDLEADNIGFNLLFASDKEEATLEALLGFEPEGSPQKSENSTFKSTARETDNGSVCAANSKVFTYRIRIRPTLNMFKDGTDPMQILDQLRTLGDMTVVAQTDEIPLLEDFDPEGCYIYWDVILTSSKNLDIVKDVFMFFEDNCEFELNIIDDTERLSCDESFKRIGEILIERGDVTPEELGSILDAQKPVGEMLMRAGLVHAGKIQSALVEQKHIRKLQGTRYKTLSTSSIRVPSAKLDTLVGLAGELVTVQARLSQTAAYRNDPELLLISEEVERLTGNLRDNTMSVRMLPVGTTLFSKFKRMVRDLSQELGKQVNLTMDGVDTELDKTVIEQLNDPLVHLIRNSIDHGIELPGPRKASGKPEVGTINLSAQHSGANVLIRISDDGGGLSPDLLRERAVSLGLIAPETQPSEKELFSFILSPGFSTANRVTSVSGRGVGMDVVKKNIESLRGTIEVDSKKGKGTTITLKLPLTLAIIEGLLVKIAEEFFVLPLSVVEECVELSRVDIKRRHDGHLANVRGEIVPYIRLRELFRVGDSPPAIEQIVITAVDAQRIGFVVDQVIGNHQTVIKSLGSPFKNIEGISGATLLGDGTVALILDIPKLIQNAKQREEGACVSRRT